MTRFTLADLEHANDAWRCNCGPSAMAAICDMTLDEVRPHFGKEFEVKGYTNPTLMNKALRSSKVEFYRVRQGLSGAPQPWPRYGLARIQWEGPWTEPGVPMRARYRQTHWVGAWRRAVNDAVSIDQDISFGRPVLRGTRVKVDVVASLYAAGERPEAIAHEFDVDVDVVRAAVDWHHGGGNIGIWDVNAMSNGSGWVELADWHGKLVPWILESYPRSDGGWHITHVFEVSRR